MAMGRIKTTFVKRKTKELVKLHGDKFTTDFITNKNTTRTYVDVPSKKLRNIIAGYITRLKKQGQ
jgi:small subunit ribosomal protein S17e